MVLPTRLYNVNHICQSYKFDSLHPVADPEEENSVPTYVYHTKINKHDDHLYTNLSSRENLYENVNKVPNVPYILMAFSYIIVCCNVLSIYFLCDTTGIDYFK